MTTFLQEWAEKHRAEFYSHVRPWIGIGAAACAAVGRRLTHEEYAHLIDKVWDGANSYERKLLFPLLDDEALCKHAEYCVGELGGELDKFTLARGYSVMVQQEIAPLLVRRLRIANTKLGADDAELDLARREAAAWEVQCQDLRDKLVQVRQELDDRAELEAAARELYARQQQS